MANASPKERAVVFGTRRRRVDNIPMERTPSLRVLYAEAAEMRS
jgi:hypothetical protein